MPKHVKAGIILFIFVLLFLRVPRDYDLWWHLAVGRFIVTTHSLPYLDIFSFSNPAYLYSYHSWLSEVGLYLVYTTLGIMGVSILYAVLGGVGVFMLGETYHITPFLLLLVPLFSFTIGARTQMVSFFFLCLLARLWNKTDPHLLLHNVRKFMLLFLFWANFHGGFMIGLFTLLLLMATSRLNKKLMQTYLVVFGLCLAATLVNPYGFRTHLQAIQMAADPTIARFNLDWQPLLDGRLQTTILAVILVVGLGGSLLSKKSNLQDKIIIIILSLLTFYSRRYALPLSVFLYPAIAEALRFFYDWIQQKHFSRSMIPIFIALSLFPALFGLQTIFHISDIFSSSASDRAYASPSSLTAFPYGAVRYLSTHTIPARLLNYADWGGYLAWHFPTHRFFIDGRMDAFFVNGVSFAKTYITLVFTELGWEKIFRSYEFDGVLAPLHASWPLVTYLKTQENWRVVYEDDVSILLVKTK